MAYYTQYNVKENGRSTLRGLLTDKDRLIANIRDGDKDMQRDFIIRRMMFKLNNLIDFAKNIDVNINLIPWNPVNILPFESPSSNEVHNFVDLLEKAGLNVTLRKKRGQKIGGACGQLGKTVN